ncbi:putative ribonuclease H-like domain-containing protein [Tanacetum coccineum]
MTLQIKTNLKLALGTTSDLPLCTTHDQAMKIEHYLSHTDYPIWEVIQKGNGPVNVSTDTNGVMKVLPPKTAEEILARERERKARTTLLMALPEDHLAKFHKMSDAKEMWDAIKSRFGGNDESKKMQKYILKQQFEGFSVSNSEGLHKGYDIFQSLQNRLEIHGADVSTEDANQKFLRSLPSSWSQVSLVLRTKPRVDSLSFDDFTDSTNDVSTAYGVSTTSGHNSQKEIPSSYSFFANQSSCPQLDHKDLEQLDEFDLVEMDLKWQVAMISIRLKKFYKKSSRKLQIDAKEPVGFDKTKVKCFNCHKTGNFVRDCRSKGNQDARWRDAGNSRNKANERRPGKQEESNALMTLDGDGVDWTSHSEEEQENFALMAYNNSGSDTEAYTQALKKVEAQLVAHQQNQLWYEEKIWFMKIDLDDKTDVLIYHKKLLAEAQKEKDELKAKVEKWHNSSKSLNILLNSQMSVKDKTGLRYGNHLHNGVLSYENEVFGSVFDTRSSDIEDTLVNDRYAEGMHTVPPPMIGIYIPSGPDKEIDESQFIYGPKQSQSSESATQTSNFDSCESNSSVETLESMPESVVNEPNEVSQPKVWSDAPIIEEYESDSDDDCVSTPAIEQEQPSFAVVNTTKHVKTPREPVKDQNICSQSPKVDKRNWNGLMSKKLGLGYGFARNACFVCGSFGHLIRDCDFHEKRMAKQAELNKRMVVLTRTGKIPFNTARHNFDSQAILTSVARKVNTVKPFMNNFRPKTIFHKAHSPFRRPSQRTIALKTNLANQKVNTAGDKAVSAVGGIRKIAVKSLVDCVWRPKRNYVNKFSKYNGGSTSRKFDDPHKALKNKGIVDSGCSRHMTRNKAYLDDYQDYNRGPVAFGGSKCYITGKGKIKTRKLDFEDVSFVKELQHFNHFSVPQICDKKNKVLFTYTECLVLSPDFKFPDENEVLLKVPRQNNMYSFNLENIVPLGGLACLIAKATTDESNMWHKRLGHVNFKNLNKLMKGNLVRGSPSKVFQNDHTCVACQKGKQHKASCKAKSVSSISQPLQLLHMDLFEPTFVRSINHKTYCLVITDDFSRFSWVFFLRTKDETSAILKEFIRQIENQLNKKVKTIRCDNGTEFKNKDMIEFYGSKGIKRENSNARTAQQNGVVERKNRTLIEAARTMLADSFLPNTFRQKQLVLLVMSLIGYIRPFGCHVTILNTIDHLGKFDGKYDKGFLVGYSLNSKAFRVYNLETKRVEENLHILFLENKPNVAGKGPTWPFDLDYLTDSMNYQPVRLENQANKPAGPKEANHSAGTQVNTAAGSYDLEDEHAQEYYVLPIWSSYTSTIKSLKINNGGKKPNEDTGLKPNEELVDQEEQAFLEELERIKRQEKEANDAAEALRKDLLHQTGAARASGTKTVSTVSTVVSTASPSRVFSTSGPSANYDDSQIPALEDIYENPSEGIFTNSSYDDEGAEADFTNLENTMNVSAIPTLRIHTIHPKTQILGDPNSAVQIRSKVNKSSGAHALKISEALEEESWVDAMQEELLQFKLKKVWILVDFPNGKRAIGTKQEEGIDYDEVFAPMARIETIRIFLAFASYIGFIVYQMDVKSAFLYDTIDEEVYVSQPLGFVDPKHPKKVYKVVKA